MMTLNVAMVTGMIGLLAVLTVQAGESNAGSGGPDRDAARATAADTPFFCNLNALTSAERAEQREVTRRVLESVQSTKELADGYAFSLDSARVSIKDLAAFVDFERRCCPFFDFRLDWRRENGPVTVQLTGRDGVKEFIRAEFARLFPK